MIVVRVVRLPICGRKFKDPPRALENREKVRAFLGCLIIHRLVLYAGKVVSTAGVVSRLLGDRKSTER